MSIVHFEQRQYIEKLTYHRPELHHKTIKISAKNKRTKEKFRNFSPVRFFFLCFHMNSNFLYFFVLCNPVAFDSFFVPNYSKIYRMKKKAAAPVTTTMKITLKTLTERRIRQLNLQKKGEDMKLDRR